MTDHQRDEGLSGIIRRGDLGVVVLGALLLLGGWMVRAGQVDRTDLHRFEGVSVETPKGWMSMPGTTGQRRILTDVLVSDTFKPRVTLTAEPLPQEHRPEELASTTELNLQGVLSLFHRIKTHSFKLGQLRAVRIDYAYALNPAALPDDPAATDVPVAVRASTLVVVMKNRLLQIDVAQSAAQQKADPALADRVLATVKVGSR